MDSHKLVEISSGDGSKQANCAVLHSQVRKHAFSVKNMFHLLVELKQDSTPTICATFWTCTSTGSSRCCWHPRSRWAFTVERSDITRAPLTLCACNG